MGIPHKGRYKPVNPEKYNGSLREIVYRSSWELKYMRWCDLREDVIEWSSEEIVIPYKSPIDRRWHRYFPDMYVRVRNKKGKIEHWLVEIKPHHETQEPKRPKRITRDYANRVATYATNVAKWEAAKEYCKERNWKFIILTENELAV